MIEDHKENGGNELAIILVDIIKAFDSIEHWHIYKVLEDYGIHGHHGLHLNPTW